LTLCRTCCGIFVVNLNEKWDVSCVAKGKHVIHDFSWSRLSLYIAVLQTQAANTATKITERASSSFYMP
jgi:hypothetical protein